MSGMSFGSVVMAAVVALGVWFQTGLAGEPPSKPTAAASAGAERHLKNIRQLTFGRQNAEAYFSFDGTKLICQ